MKKHQIKNNPPAFSHPLDKGDNIRMKKAFTLVELIIVITILAILATIAFVSFSSYTASSRDTKRIVTIESIAKGLNIFQTQTGKYPNIDNQSSTGIINSDTLSFVGEVGDNVSKLINISPTPKDPVSGNNFKYATSFDNKYFQVAGTQEKQVAEKSIINQSYANTRQAKVLGNYNGLLKYGTKLYNLPSLLYTGSGYLVSNATYFIVDKGQNIPYKISSTDPDNSVQTSVILSQLTGTSSVSLTGVTLPSTPGELKTNINSIVQILGYPGDKIGQESFGTQYFVSKPSVNNQSSFICGENVSSGGENYTTKTLGDGKCWTTQNMRHEVDSCLSKVDDSDPPFDKCVESMPKSPYGLMYNSDSGVAVCQSLGLGWRLPSSTDWENIDLYYTDSGFQCTEHFSSQSCYGAGGNASRRGDLISYFPGIWEIGSNYVQNHQGFRLTSQMTTSGVEVRQLYSNRSGRRKHEYPRGFSYSVVCVRD